MVQYFLQLFPNDARFKGFTIGGEGAEVNTGDARIENFVHQGVLFTDHAGDQASRLGELSSGELAKSLSPYLTKFFGNDVKPKERAGSDILIDSDVENFNANVSSFFGSQHNENLYLLDVSKLVKFANDASSPFATTAFAGALKSGAVYQGASVQIAVGAPQQFVLDQILPVTFINYSQYASIAYDQDVHVYGGDNYVLGTIPGTARANNPNNGIVIDTKIVWDQPSAQDVLHIVDGGQGFNAVVLPGVSSSYNWVPNSGVVDLFFSGAVKIGQLYRINELIFTGQKEPVIFSNSADQTSSLQEAAADATAANQYVVKLDGSLVQVQSPANGQTALTVDHHFDYVDTGNANLTITGTGFGDIIVVGTGNVTVSGGSGNDLIFVKDAHRRRHAGHQRGRRR